MNKLFALTIFVVLFSGCLGYQKTDWPALFQKQQGEKVEIEGYIGGSLTYPTQIFKQDELQGYLLNAKFGKQTTGVPLLLKEQIVCDSNHVIVRGEIVKRGVQPVGSDFVEMLDWIIVKVNETQCLPSNS
jgi:hypothetical protein